MARLDADAVGEMKLKELHRQLLDRFNKAVEDLLMVHADLTALDPESTAYLGRKVRFNEAQAALWGFKNTIWNVS